MKKAKTATSEIARRRLEQQPPPDQPADAAAPIPAQEPKAEEPLVPAEPPERLTLADVVARKGRSAETLAEPAAPRPNRNPSPREPFAPSSVEMEECMATESAGHPPEQGPEDWDCEEAGMVRRSRHPRSRHSKPQYPIWPIVAAGAVALALSLGLTFYFLSEASPREPRAAAAPPPQPMQPTEGALSEGIWSPKFASEFLSLRSDTQQETRATRDERVRTARGVALMSAEELAQALEAAEAEALIRPLDGPTQHFAGVLARAAGQPDKAKYYFTKALDVAPGSRGPLLALALTEFELGNYRSTAGLLDAYRENNPQNVAVNYRRAFCAILLDEDISFDALGLGEDTPAGLYLRAAAAAKHGDPASAAEFLQRARASTPAESRTFESDIRLVGLE